jgi:lysophospholipase L1-like esterase
MQANSRLRTLGSRGMLSRLLPRLLLLFASLAVVFAVAEVAARLWLGHAAGVDQLRRYASIEQARAWVEASGESLSLYDRHPYVGFVASANYRFRSNRHNVVGTRGEELAVPKPLGEFRIVCIGGSTTYTSSVIDPAESYPAQLQASLHTRGFTNVRVVNAGVPGYRSYESVLNFQLRLLDLEPDMVVVYHAANDVLARMVWPPDAYRNDNSGGFRAGRGLDSELPWLERSTVLRMLLIELGRARSPLAHDSTFVEWQPEYYGARFLRQQQQGVYPARAFVKAPVERMLAANPPVGFRRNLEHLVVIARHRGIVPVLMSFVSCPCRPGGLGSQEMLDGIAEMNVLQRDLALQQDIPFFDLAAVFPPDEALFLDSIHMSAAGAGRQAELLADFLVGSQLIPAVERGSPEGLVREMGSAAPSTSR